jgi:hypothetical protein
MDLRLRTQAFYKPLKTLGFRVIQANSQERAGSVPDRSLKLTFRSGS